MKLQVLWDAQWSLVEREAKRQGVLYSANQTSLQPKLQPAVQPATEPDAQLTVEGSDLDPIQIESPIVRKPRPLRKLRQKSSTFLLAAAAAIFLLTFAPLLILETRSMILKAAAPVSALPSSPSDNPTSATHLASITPTADQRFALHIPKLNLDSQVVANVPTDRPEIYLDALQRGIAHAAGSGLPGTPGNKRTYLFSHSTDAPWNILRFNAAFYALKDLETGDEINLTFWGEEYAYRVVGKHIVEAEDTTWLQPKPEGVEELVLQTCYPPGTTWKRLVIVAERI